MDDERLARYLAGQASDADRSQIEAWAKANPAHDTELRRLQAAWVPSEPAGAWNVDGAWAKVAAQLDRPAKPPISRRPVVGWLAAAAAILAVGAGSWVAIGSRPTRYETAVGERREVVLSDGSKVTLAPASRLEVLANFGNPIRGVTLTGKAWFEVDHDEARPFRVQVGKTMVEDLGTEFEIDATTTDLVVSVMSGSVAIHAGSATPVTLGPNDVATVAASGASAVDHQVEVERFIAWRKGTLSFENRPLRQVLTELERWHEISFSAKDDVLERTFTGDIPTNRLDVALATLTTAMGLTANQVGTTVTLAHKAAP